MGELRVIRVPHVDVVEALMPEERAGIQPRLLRCDEVLRLLDVRPLRGTCLVAHVAPPCFRTYRAATSMPPSSRSSVAATASDTPELTASSFIVRSSLSRSIWPRS